MPPFGAAFALEKGGASELFPCALAAAVAWVAGVVCVKFWVVNPWEDFQGDCAEACSSLFLDLHVGAYFWGPLDQVVPNRAEAAATFT